MNFGDSDNEVVVGIDGSPDADSALEWAAAEAHLREAPLRILHATGLRAEVGSKPLPAESQRLALDAARALLDEAHDRVVARFPGMKTETALAHDRPAEALQTASQTAALVVLGTRGRGGFTALLLGSTSLRTAAHTACPLVVVRGDRLPQPDGTVLVGVRDLTDAEAIGFALATAQRWKSSVRALHAWEPLGEMGRVAPQVDTVHAIHAEHVRLLSAAMDAAQVTSRTHVTREVVDGTTAAVLVEASEDAHLLVMGSHRPSSPFGLRLGLIVHALVHHAHCPVAIVPEHRRHPV